MLKFIDVLEFGAVVQWLEYLPVTQGVVGSNPISTAIRLRSVMVACLTVYEVEGFESHVVG